MVKITILSPEGKSCSVWSLKHEIEKLGAECDIFLLSNPETLMTHDFKLDTDLIHSRCGIGDYFDRLTLYSWQFINALEIEGFKFVNPIKTLYLTSDKFKCIKLLTKNKINVPKTALIRDYEDAVKFIEKYNLSFPVVVKNSFSKCGLKVFMAKNHDELKELTKNAIWEGKLIQEFVDFKENGLYKDMRILVVDGEVVGGYRRVSKDFRTNLYLGNAVEKLNIDEELKELALKCAELSNAIILGVDILPTKDNYYVIELNSSPGTKGFRSIGINADKKIAEALVKYAKS
ncbi:coenzyme gamma-F420-2:alpha-L-glutamate ligase [Methanocaldococcus fervens]|uniref:Coenzyme gamma-F420-2:alpha-L-glutamate ligase n=1 Tax=Methanocaldococcus fervens (strain DSM 4213 / JCM 15782 / AG86) TaxID=573064 RepID=C7P906_METFA|nr:coenzyme gamma-F420-2:alpha-L-glutamate ligase [Methanocaldococcus fervens]ACV25038.1 alpha-L-glutamate ligase, RimK family [Methanocaldococcus fervens AG86]